jgi:hypothetical protein
VKKSARADTTGTAERASASTSLVARHVRLGWLALLVFLTLGIALEAMHGFKVAWYMNVANETRRFMWTLAHAHGTLLGLVQLGYAFTLRELELEAQPGARIDSACLNAATVLLPGGFFLGGVMVYGGDPGVGILLVPVGALLLLAAVVRVWRRAANA